MTVLKVRYERYSRIRAITISLSLPFSPFLYLSLFLCLSLHCTSRFFKALVLGNSQRSLSLVLYVDCFLFNNKLLSFADYRWANRRRVEFSDRGYSRSVMGKVSSDRAD